jgi:hypothetical protein
MDYSQGWFFLGWWPLLFSLEWWCRFPGTGCMVPQSYLEFWTVIGDLWYPGYFTLTVAPEPSVEQVAGAGQSTVGEIGSNMVMWSLLQNSAVKLWG